MNFVEIEEYARNHDYDSCEFLMVAKNGKLFNGKFLDAYFGMVQIPDLGDGFIRLDDIRKAHGFDFCSFIPLNYQEDNGE